jgi:tetraacyldisaccharide 4'-kinase
MPHQTIFFTTIKYGTPYHITHHQFTTIDEHTEVLLVTGIANPVSLKSYLEERIHTYHMMHYGDHHIFTLDDWKEIKKRFNSMDADKKIILTTEKDAMRLLKYENDLKEMPLYVIPIEHKFLFGEGQRFNHIVSTFIQNFKQPARA